MIVNVFLVLLIFLIILLATAKVLNLQAGFKHEQPLTSLIERLLFLLTAFTSLALLMDFVHELGHALLGVALGGRLLRMQVAYLELYPGLRLTPNFVLGRVWVEGLAGFNLGLFTLGGSLATNLASWLLALLLMRRRFGSKTRLALRIAWLIGLLDLPFYVIFPQMGLQHWIFIGGGQPEPLIGARMMGIPDPVFYAFVVLTTLGLGLPYLKLLLRSLRDRFPEILNRLKQRLSLQ